MGEDRSEKLDRELMELLNELRVALPGIQVLFAFLLTVPFSQRFERLLDYQRSLYFGAFMATAVASVLLMAPTAYHRLRWRQYDKEQMLRTANRLTLAGLLAMATALGTVVFLIGDVLFSSAVAASFCGVLVALLSTLWFGLPLVRRAKDGSGTGKRAA